MVFLYLGDIECMDSDMNDNAINIVLVSHWLDRMHCGACHMLVLKTAGQRG